MVSALLDQRYLEFQISKKELAPRKVLRDERLDCMPYNEPFGEDIAKRLIRDCLTRGNVRWTDHVLERCSERGLTTVDCVNALKSGTVAPAEWENGTWRYRVRAGKITVVIAFRDLRTLTVITAWT